MARYSCIAAVANVPHAPGHWQRLPATTDLQPEQSSLQFKRLDRKRKISEAAFKSPWNRAKGDTVDSLTPDTSTELADGTTDSKPRSTAARWLFILLSSATGAAAGLVVGVIVGVLSGLIPFRC